MKRQDMGIDIIVETEGGNFIAVQCKYKTPTGFKQNVLSWKTLSTFYALCLRTGPWSKFIVITNCIYTRHQGKKTPQDISYCVKTLQNIKKDEWLRMCQVSGEKIGYLPESTITNDVQIISTVDIAQTHKIKSAKLPSIEEIRLLRQKRFSL